MCVCFVYLFFFQAEDGIRDLVRSRGLGDVYKRQAQSNPDEDFAETFAVWLDPHSNWKEEYRRWPHVLKKLKYIDPVSYTHLTLPTSDLV